MRPVKKQVRFRSEDSISTLQDCMEITDWNIFREAATLSDHTDLQECTMTVLDYISKCVDDTTTTKTITVPSNWKPWMTGGIQSLLKTRHTALRTGDAATLKKQETTWLGESEELNNNTERGSATILPTTGIRDNCGEEPKPSWTINPCTGL